ncbi:MAG: ABC transporter permease [Vicinamibacterales bacterium]
MRVHDLRLAVRALARRPGFAAAAILLLALGAGANAAVFSVVRGVLLRPLPFAEPDRLVAVWPGAFVSSEDVGYWRDNADTLDQVASFAPGWLMAMAPDDGGEAMKVTGARVSANLFELLGARAALGRALRDEESAPGRDRVAVLSDGLWRRRFGGSPAVIGRTVLIDEAPYQVVGVMPAGFELFGSETDLWLPLPWAPGTAQHTTTFSQAVARLAPGASAASATAELQAMANPMRAALHRPDDWGRTMRAAPLIDALTGEARPPLLLLLGAVGLVLLLAAANLGTLVLGRAVERARELAVRTALGASRAALVRQLVAEQAVLAVTGALGGLGIAALLLPALVARIPPEIPRQGDIALDGPVFGLVLVVSVTIAVLMAAIPAAVAVRPGVAPLLREQRTTGTPARSRALGALVAAQVALAVVLGVGAGLMLRSLWNLQHVDPGFDARDVLMFRLQTTSKYRSLTTGEPLLAEVAGRLRSLPGVDAVGAIGHLPLSGYAWSIPVRDARVPLAAGEEAPQTGWRFIWSDYFEAMRIPLLAGRRFTEADRADAPAVVILNETMARRLFGGPAAAVGQRVVQYGGSGPGESELEVVGVVGDVRHVALDEAPSPEIFRPLQQTFMFPMNIVVRTTGSPASLAPAVRQVVHDIDPGVPVADLQPLPVLLVDAVARPRLLAQLLAVFAGVGLVLSVVGLYGVVAYQVRQREREIGIRMALGAAPGRLARGVVGQGLRYAAAGLVVGLPAAWASSTIVESQIYGVAPRDPVTFGALPAVLAVVTVLACYLPARRAARIDPAVTMRSE